MLFNSYTFIIFLILVVCVSRVISPWPARKAFLLFMSYTFYAAWNPPFVLLLIFSSVVDWFFGKAIFKSDKQSSRRIFLALSLTVNLGLLGFFKYGTFVLENFTYIVNSLGIDFHPAKPDIILPVGISFYTFQTLSYVFDIYKNKSKPWKSFLDYALYVTFFPQLVAGPIIRAAHFLPQCQEPKKADLNQIGWGLTLIVVGLFNKVVIADHFMSPVVEKVFDNEFIPSFFEAWAGVIAFSIQIFCDFSGYSTIAIGTALCLGFVLTKNFHFPYAALGFSDFWRRWHISLSTWLKDYLYIPLGGNREGEIKSYANLMVTMLLGGLWHGASWLFVIWGGLHGVYLVSERLIKKTTIASYALWNHKISRIFLSLVTFFFVCVAWVFFRVSKLKRAFNILASMFGFNSLDVSPDKILVSKVNMLGTFAFLLAVLFIHNTAASTSFEEVSAKIPWYLKSVILALMIYIILISFLGVDSAFIYFQF